MYQEKGFLRRSLVLKKHEWGLSKTELMRLGKLLYKGKELCRAQNIHGDCKCLGVAGAFGAFWWLARDEFVEGGRESDSDLRVPMYEVRVSDLFLISKRSQERF